LSFHLAFRISFAAIAIHDALTIFHIRAIVAIFTLHRAHAVFHALAFSFSSTFPGFTALAAFAVLAVITALTVGAFTAFVFALSVVSSSKGTV